MAIEPELNALQVSLFQEPKLKVCSQLFQSIIKYESKYNEDNA